MGTQSDNKISITKKDVIWSYIAQIFNIGANIIILPLVLAILPSDILGVWYVFLTIGSFVTLLDFGFQPTFTRNVAFVFSGATSLQKEGIDYSQTLLDSPNYDLLNQLIKTMQKFYGYMTIAMIFLLLTLGSYYVWFLSASLPQQTEIMTAWAIYAIGVSLSFYYYYFNSLLLGRGFVKENNLVTIITKSTYILTAGIGLIFGYGIMSVACATCLSIIVNRFFAIKFFYKNGLRKKLKSLGKCTKEQLSSLFKIIKHNAIKVGSANLAIFFTTKGNIFFVSYFLPLDIVGQYGLTIQIITFIATISMLYFQAHIPLVSKYRVENNRNSITTIFGEGVFVMLFGYLILSCIIFFLGNYILMLIGSKTFLLSKIPLFLLLLIYLLDTNHAIALNLLVTKNTIPYLIAALISGFSIGILSPIFMGVFKWGIYGAIFATGIIQLLYHNWKWPLEASKDLGKNYIQILNIGFLSLKRKASKYI